jgi:hypothetical protein
LKIHNPITFHTENVSLLYVDYISCSVIILWNRKKLSLTTHWDISDHSRQQIFPIHSSMWSYRNQLIQKSWLPRSTTQNGGRRNRLPWWTMRWQIPDRCQVIKLTQTCLWQQFSV